MKQYSRSMTLEEIKDFITNEVLLDIPENKKGWRQRDFLYFREHGTIGSATKYIHKESFKNYNELILKFYEPI